MTVEAANDGDDRVLAARAARWLRWNSSVWPHVTPALFVALGLTVLALLVTTPYGGAWLIVKLVLAVALAAIVAWDILPDGSFDMFDAWIGDKLSPQQRSAGWAILAYVRRGDIEPLVLERDQNGAATDRMLHALAEYGPEGMRERAGKALAELKRSNAASEGSTT